MSSYLYSRPDLINSYLINNLEEEEEEMDITNYLVDVRPIVCTFCKKEDHTEDNCSQFISVGNKIYLKGLEVRDFDLEMNCNGKSIYAWIESLTMLQCKFLAKRINLQSYCYMLRKSGFINMNQTILYNRANYTIGLHHYYYLKPPFSILQKKMYFNSCILSNENNDETFDCPICIENEIDMKEKIQLNCSHNVCNCCFQGYLDQLKENKKPTCSLCREIITHVHVVNEEYLYCLEKKYIL